MAMNTHMVVEDKKTHCPPNNCMPSRAKTTMKRKSRNSKLIMDFIELSSDTTRFLKEFQYLQAQTHEYSKVFSQTWASSTHTVLMTHLVTLKIRSSLSARRTLIPNEAPGFIAAQITSKILPIITCRHRLISAATSWVFIILSRVTYPEVKTVERRVKVVLGSKTIHFHGHFNQEQTQEYKFCQIFPGKRRNNNNLSD